jgi:hypothetical protein
MRRLIVFLLRSSPECTLEPVDMALALDNIESRLAIYGEKLTERQ